MGPQTRMEKVDGFNSASGGSNDLHGKPFKVKVKSNQSFKRLKDPLRQALGGGPTKQKVAQHPYTHTATVKPGGAVYEPRGAFGRVKGR